MQTALIILDIQPMVKNTFAYKALSPDQGLLSFVFFEAAKFTQFQSGPELFSILNADLRESESMTKNYVRPVLHSYELLYRYDDLANYSRLQEAVRFSEFIRHLIREGQAYPRLFNSLAASVAAIAEEEDILPWRTVCLCHFFSDYGAFPNLEKLNDRQRKIFQAILMVKEKDDLPDLLADDWKKLERWCFQHLDRLTLITPQLAEFFSFF